MPIKFIEPTKTEESMKEANQEDTAIVQKRASIVLSETQQLVERFSTIDSQIMAQDFSICIGWGKVKVCLTVETA